MIRRFGENIVAGQRYTVRAGIYAILPMGDDLLVTYQAEPAPEFQLPGGGIDPGEPPLHALYREVIEETVGKFLPRVNWGFFANSPICLNMIYGPKNYAIFIWPAQSGHWKSDRKRPYCRLDEWPASVPPIGQ